MVIVEEVPGAAVELLVPPQPLTNPIPASTTTARSSSCSLFRRRRPKKQSATASVAAGRYGRGRPEADDDEVVGETETVVETDPPCGTKIGLGLRVQV